LRAPHDRSSAAGGDAPRSRTHPMSTKSKKSPAKARHLDAALVKAAQDPAAGDLIAAGRASAFSSTDPAKCFAHFRPLAEAVLADGLTLFRGAPLLMHGNVKRALVVAEPGLSVAVARLRAPRIQDVYELPSLVLGLQFAAGRVPGAVMSQGEISSLLAEQSPWRRLALAYLDVVSDPLVGLVPRERYVKIREGSGPLDRAEDFVAIPGVFDEFAGALQGKHPFREAQLARLAEAGAQLLQQMRPGNAPKEQKSRGPEATLRDQMGALVAERFEHLLELATLGLGRAKAEAEMPALHATARTPKADAAEPKKQEAKPAEPVAVPKRPSVAPPARPSVPPPN